MENNIYSMGSTIRFQRSSVNRLQFFQHCLFVILFLDLFLPTPIREAISIDDHSVEQRNFEQEGAHQTAYC